MKMNEEIVITRQHYRFAAYVAILILAIVKIDVIGGIIVTLKNVLTPLFIGIVLAFIMNYLMVRIEKMFKKRIDQESKNYSRIRLYSLILTVLIAVLLVTFLGMVIVPHLADSISILVTNISNSTSLILDNKDNFLEIFGIDLTKYDFLDADKILTALGVDYLSIAEQLKNVVASLSGGIISFIGSSTTAVVNWFMGIMLAIFMLYRKEASIARIKKAVASFLPEKLSDKILFYSHNFYEVFHNYVGKRIVESSILALLEYIGCLIFQFPYALIIAVGTFVLSFIPYFGCLIIMIIGFILIFSVDPIKALIFVIVFLVITTLESTFILPQVIGRSLGLPEIWTILGITVFGKLWGFGGMLVAVPTVACLYSLLKDKVSEYMEKRRIKLVDGKIIKEVEEPVVETVEEEKPATTKKPRGRRKKTS
ncbi:MAG: AI-2E family transporter [Erysipelotrichaceae bacterium]|nr:AI-2E family transporter [Erysipelotrichaceae bacterium]